MKKIIFAAAVLAGCMSVQLASAQVRINLGLNIGSQPEWGPTGYNHAEYYYMPDVDAYYDVPAHQYVYNENNVWVHRQYLPVRYRNYDVYHGYKVVVNQRDPWIHHNDIRARYASYRGRHDQEIIRDSRDDRYRNHWNQGNRDHGDNGNRGHDDRGDRGNNDHGDRGHDNGNRGHDDHGDRGHGDHGDRGKL